MTPETPNAPRQLVLLYNDRDRAQVLAVRADLQPLLKPHGIRAWMASEDMRAFGDLFDNIETAISGAMGVAFFLGRHGLGRFQDNIERGAVSTELWLQGSTYGALLVHLAGGLEVPRPLLRWPTVNHDGAIDSPAGLAAGIAQRFGLAGEAPGNTP